MKELSESKRYTFWQPRRIIAGRRYRAFQALALSTLAGLAIAGLAARAHNRDTTVSSRTIDSPVAALKVADNSAGAPTGARRGPGSAPRPAAAQGGPNPKLTNLAHIAISPLGFDSKAITLPHAPFFLLVENRSGVGGVSLRVDRIDGASGNIRAKNVSREDLDWSDFFDLPPGNYLLSEAGHPDWQCRITVNP